MHLFRNHVVQIFDPRIRKCPLMSKSIQNYFHHFITFSQQYCQEVQTLPSKMGLLKIHRSDSSERATAKRATENALIEAISRRNSMLNSSACESICSNVEEVFTKEDENFIKKKIHVEKPDTSHSDKIPFNVVSCGLSSRRMIFLDSVECSDDDENIAKTTPTLIHNSSSHSMDTGSSIEPFHRNESDHSRARDEANARQSSSKLSDDCNAPNLSAVNNSQIKGRVSRRHSTSHSQGNSIHEQDYSHSKKVHGRRSSLTLACSYSDPRHTSKALRRSSSATEPNYPNHTMKKNIDDDDDDDDATDYGYNSSTSYSPQRLDNKIARHRSSLSSELLGGSTHSQSRVSRRQSLNGSSSRLLSRRTSSNGGGSSHCHSLSQGSHCCKSRDMNENLDSGKSSNELVCHHDNNIAKVPSHNVEVNNDKSYYHQGNRNKYERKVSASSSGGPGHVSKRLNSHKIILNNAKLQRTHSSGHSPAMRWLNDGSIQRRRQDDDDDDDDDDEVEEESERKDEPRPKLIRRSHRASISTITPEVGSPKTPDSSSNARSRSDRSRLSSQSERMGPKKNLSHKTSVNTALNQDEVHSPAMMRWMDNTSYNYKYACSKRRHSISSGNCRTVVSSSRSLLCNNNQQNDCHQQIINPASCHNIYSHT